MNDFLALTDGQVDTLYARAYFFTRQNSHEQAVNIFMLLCLLRPDEPKYAHAAGVCYQKMGWHQMAIPALARAMQLRPDNHAPAFQMAECMLSMGLQQDAADLLAAMVASARHTKQPATVERAEAMLGFLADTVQ